jgi:hypothetical protein
VINAQALQWFGTLLLAICAWLMWYISRHKYGQRFGLVFAFAVVVGLGGLLIVILAFIRAVSK